MPNFSSLAGLEVAEKFLWGVGGVVCTVIFMSNPTVVLRLGWGFDNKMSVFFQMFAEGLRYSQEMAILSIKAQEVEYTPSSKIKKCKYLHKKKIKTLYFLKLWKSKKRKCPCFFES